MRREEIEQISILRAENRVVVEELGDHENAHNRVLDPQRNGRNDVGILGGNILMRLKMRGVEAAVTDGGMRDMPEIVGLGMPVCCTASAPPPSFTKLMLVETECVVSCAGVPI